MNLSQFIDKLLVLETKLNEGLPINVEVPVYVVDTRSGDSNLVNSPFIRKVEHAGVEGELLDVDEGTKYVEIGVG